MRPSLILAVLLAFLSPAQAGFIDDFELFVQIERARLYSVDSFIGDAAWVEAEADPRFREAAKEVKARNYGNAARLLRSLAEEGNSKAQLLLGMLLNEGIGIEQDFAQGMSFIKQAATQGLMTAKVELAKRNLNPAQEDIDLQLLEQIAETGDVFAHLYLGFLYSTRMSDDPEDEKKAFDWFLKAAEAGDSFAMSQVAELYYTGVGIAADGTEVQADIVEAIRWGVAAADLNDPGGQYVLGMVYTGALTDWKFQNWRKGVAWFHRAAEQGHRGAQSKLAIAYSSGEGIPKDLTTAYTWAKIADIKIGDTTAIDLAPEMTSEQIAEGEQRALEWLEERGMKSP